MSSSSGFLVSRWMSPIVQWSKYQDLLGGRLS
eukprot:CAMPEP_0172510898 /NCGR_PEP_ID=MMETSP1066-20121228/232253_2 /TAXON_ID=671091 /ORGANISM="Coscinodiscus wailesii, Strain CCMP2513" /LENGTH=31 /DNA_ID= /DNA_START= /DNA_END= /DNA_ORIENTATION=